MTVRKIIFVLTFSVVCNSCSGSNDKQSLSSAFYSVLLMHKQNKPDDIENLLRITNGIDATGILNTNKYFEEGVQVLNKYGIPDSSSYVISEKNGDISVSASVRIVDSVETHFVFNASFILKEGGYLLASYLAYYFPNPHFISARGDSITRFNADIISEFENPFSLNITWTDSIIKPQGFLLIMDKNEFFNFVNEYDFASIIKFKDLPSDTVDFDVHDFLLPQHGNRSLSIVYNYYLLGHNELKTLEIKFSDVGVESKPVPLIYISDGTYFKYIELTRDSHYFKLIIQFLSTLDANER